MGRSVLEVAVEVHGDRAVLELARDYGVDPARLPWSVRARPEQLLPDGDWLTWLVLAGRGFGKTRTAVEAVIQWAREGEYRQIAIVAPTAADVRDVLIEGPAGVLACSPAGFRPHYEPSKCRVAWPNGVVAHTYSADEPDRLRGPQHHAAICDEAASWKVTGKATKQGSAMDMLMFGLRLGQRPRRIITTTPRPLAWLRDLVKDPACVVTRGSTYDNRANLAEPFFRQIVTKYEGTRLGRQELNAEILEDVPGALWTLAMIEGARVVEVPQLRRIVVGLDPAVTANEDSDESGIVAAGVDMRDPPHYYVLADASLVASPLAWARAAVGVYELFDADRIVPEVNNGGDLVVSNIHTVAPNVPVKPVRATRGKMVRAEPVAALYEQGRVHHVGVFAALEDQLTSYSPLTAEKSPDRMDALVWAITDLMGSQVPGIV